jgi:Family of unknown function (DUF5946)
MTTEEIICPGCGLNMPQRDGAVCSSYFNVSPECWDVFTEVLATEYSNAFLFGRVHQLTVDTYAVQHAGEKHPDKSVMVHLMGLHLVLVRGVNPAQVAPLLQRAASRAHVWPHFIPPVETVSLNIFDVALAESTESHIRLVREWSRLVWNAWSSYHSEIADFVSQHLASNVESGIR